jgi:hypothetical protein
MLIYFMAIWNISWIFGIFYDHLVHFVFIWYIYSGFGIMYQEKSVNPASNQRRQLERTNPIKPFHKCPRILHQWLLFFSLCVATFLKLPPYTPSGFDIKTQNSLGGETPSRIRAWSLIRNKKKTIVLFERHCHAAEKSKAMACARRCRSSQLKRWWTQKRIIGKKWRAKEEERHKGSLTLKKDPELRRRRRYP